jgi:hypothetical protein
MYVVPPLGGFFESHVPAFATVENPDIEESA